MNDGFIGNEYRFALSYDPFVFTTGHFEPGSALAYCKSQKEQDKRSLGLAELMYYRGDSAKAVSEFSHLLSGSGDDSSELALADFFAPMCFLAGGSAWEFIRSYNGAKEKGQKLPPDSMLKKINDAFVLCLDILTHNVSDIHFPSVSIHEVFMPAMLKPIAFYIYARYLLETGDVGRAIGIAESTLIFMEKPCPVAEIYLSLIISRGYMIRQMWDRAEHYFRHAWSLATPDGLLMPFAEHRAMLFGMLEKCLRYEEPEIYKKILRLANKYHRNWAYIHNELTGESIADSLAAIEYNVASLASRGMLNTEIADFLGISVNSVRSHLRNVFNKLNVKSRKELSKYVI